MERLICGNYTLSSRHDSPLRVDGNGRLGRDALVAEEGRLVRVHDDLVAGKVLELEQRKVLVLFPVGQRPHAAYGRGLGRGAAQVDRLVHADDVVDGVCWPEPLVVVQHPAARIILFV